MADFKHYEKDGKTYHRFSSVVDYFPHPKLVDWKVKMGKREGNKVSNLAKKIGSRVDMLCEQDVLHGKYRLIKTDRPETIACMKAWEEWKKDYKAHFEDIKFTQHTVYYDDWGVAGTPDLVGSDRIIDIKTSKVISLSYWVQLAFYNRHFKMPERYVLDLSKDLGTYEYVRCPEEYSQEYLEQVFVGMLNVFNFYQEEEGRTL